MTKEVRFYIDVPENIDDIDLIEFLNYALDIYGSCSIDNPLVDGDLDQLNPRNMDIY